jgi:hypothetical protein
MLCHELAVLAPQRFAQTNRGVTAKVGQAFSLFFTHMFVVGSAGTSDRRPPLIARYFRGIRVTHAVANVVVVTDSIKRLALGIVGTP